MSVFYLSVLKGLGLRLLHGERGPYFSRGKDRIAFLGYRTITSLRILIDLQELAFQAVIDFFRSGRKEKVSLRKVVSDRGDVPGWVLVVLMTAGLVTGIWTVAAPRLNQILRSSLDSMNAIR